MNPENAAKRGKTKPFEVLSKCVCVWGGGEGRGTELNVEGALK